MTKTSEDDVAQLISDEVQTNIDKSDIMDDELLHNGEAKLILPSGDALSINETHDIVASENTKTIILVGPSACGKTTIETTLYQLFQNGCVGDYFFAGSNTLQAYESRSFFTRTASKYRSPMTPRTSRGIQETFLHLKVWNKEKDYYQELLFADMSGEEFESHIGNVEAMQRDFGFLKAVDYIVGVFNGELLCSKKQRNGVVEEMAQLLRTIGDSGLISKHTKLQVIFSKYDILESHIGVDQTTGVFIAKIIEDIKARLKDYINDIEFYYVAAMPEDTSKFEIGYGVRELFYSWCDRESNPFLSFGKRIINKSVGSELDKLQYKIMGENYE